MIRYAKARFPHSFASIAKRSALVSLVALALVVPVVEAQTQEEIDPWEGYNRWMFDFNGDADRWIIRPVAKGYDATMPEFGRVGVLNFFSNFYDFNGALNSLLQGRIEQAVNNTFRVVANSTIGLFGLFDVASMAGIPRYETDFGHTLSIWGVPRGNFLVLPIIGPSTVRSSFGASIDAYISPPGQMMNDQAYWGLRAFDALDIRARLLDAEEIMTGDRYLFFRDAYLQSRAALEAGGQVPDDFSEFDSDWDEDEF